MCTYIFIYLKKFSNKTNGQTYLKNSTTSDIFRNGPSIWVVLF